MIGMWEAVPAVWRAISVLGAAFVAGSFAIGATVRGDVRELDTKVDTIFHRVEQVEENYDKLLCLQLAELEGTHWQRCIR